MGPAAVAAWPQLMKKQTACGGADAGRASPARVEASERSEASPRAAPRHGAHERRHEGLELAHAQVVHLRSGQSKWLEASRRPLGGAVGAAPI